MFFNVEKKCFQMLNFHLSKHFLRISSIEPLNNSYANILPTLVIFLKHLIFINREKVLKNTKYRELKHYNITITQ